MPETRFLWLTCAGHFGGGEFVVHEMEREVLADLKSRHGITILEPLLRLELRKACRRLLMHGDGEGKLCWKDNCVLSLLQKEPFNVLYYVRPDHVRRALERGFKDSFTELKKMIHNPVKGSLLVVSGGSANHPWAKERILAMAKSSPYKTTFESGDMIESWKAGEMLSSQPINALATPYDLPSTIFQLELTESLLARRNA